jgi:hypothetical protein
MMSLTTMSATSSLMHCDEARVRHHAPDQEVGDEAGETAAENAAVSTADGARRTRRLIATGVLSLLVTSMLLLNNKRVHERPARPVAAPVAAVSTN